VKQEIKRSYSYHDEREAVEAAIVAKVVLFEERRTAPRGERKGRRRKPRNNFKPGADALIGGKAMWRHGVSGEK